MSENKKKPNITFTFEQAADLTIAMLDDLKAGKKALEEAESVIHGAASLLDDETRKKIEVRMMLEADPFQPSPQDLEDLREHIEESVKKRRIVYE